MMGSMGGSGSSSRLSHNLWTVQGVEGGKRSKVQRMEEENVDECIIFGHNAATNVVYVVPEWMEAQ